MNNYAPSANVQDEVLTFLLASPTAEQIMTFRASEAAQEHLRFLLESSRNGTLSDSQRAELEEASQINHFVLLLKAKARQSLQAL
ncbi:MAG: hypothetical protein SGJ24_19910 [Chloroflexota bacterium]|nr:hypothetical protein [Chloroflexota bacterium]